MANKIQIPVTSTSAVPVVVPDHFKLADSIQLALMQLGDGFFPFKGSMTVGGHSRLIKELNGEVIPGTGLQVKVRDFSALIDGVVLSDKNKSQFNPTDFATLTVPVGTRYVVLSAPRIVGTDGVDRPDTAVGVLSLATSAPLAGSGSILVASVIVPAGTTQVTSAMIDMSQKAYLVDLGEEFKARRAKDAELEGKIATGGGGSSTDLSAIINIAKTNFKVDSMMWNMMNEMYKGWIDVFVANTDLDPTASDAGYRVGGYPSMLRVAPYQGDGIPDVVGYWKANEPSGSSVLLDSVGANNGYVVNTTERVAGKEETATHKDAVAIVSPCPVDLNNSPWTIMCWMKMEQPQPGVFFGNWHGDDSRLDLGTFMLWITEGPIFISTHHYGNFALPTSTYTSFQDGQWHHIALSYDGSSSLKFYLDGAMTNDFTGVPNLWGGTLPLAFNSHNALSEYGNGCSVDGMAIVSRAISDAEVQLAFTKVDLLAVGEPTVFPIKVVSQAHAAPEVPTSVMVVAEDTGDVTYSVSRDDGATWTVAALNTETGVTGATGTAVRVKMALPAQDSAVDSLAVFWK